MGLINNLQWIDIVVFIAFLRIIHISNRCGFLNEIIKLFGAFSASFFSLQYYLFLGGIFEKMSFFLYQEYFGTVSFIAIFYTIILLFLILRRALSLFLKKDKNCLLWERITSLLLGGARFSLLVSVFIFVAHLFPPTTEAAGRSFSYKIFKKIAPQTYISGFQLYSKINPWAVLNEKVTKY